MSAMLALGGALKLARKFAAGAVRWLAGHPWQAALIIAAAWIAWTQLVTIPNRDATIASGEARIVALQDDVADRTRERDDERLAHQGTKDTYRAAQATAAELERRRLARVVTEQQEITDDVTQDLRARVAAARSTAERLRQQLAQAGAGADGAAAAIDLPGAGGATGGADAPASGGGLPFGADELDWRLTATEQAIQLDELISWVERQAAVDPNR